MRTGYVRKTAEIYKNAKIIASTTKAPTLPHLETKNEFAARRTLRLKGNDGQVHSPEYTRDNFIPEDFRVLVDEVVAKIKVIREKHPDIEAIAAIGHSGLMLMGAVSYLTGLPQIAIRKHSPDDHDHRDCNGWLGCKGYLFIDDLVDSGNSLRKVYNAIQNESKNNDLKPPKMVACLMYRRSWNETETVRHTTYNEAGTMSQGSVRVPSYGLTAVSLDTDAL
jgi:orotate phosphoribosyltransferase